MGKPAPKKPKTVFSGGKVMATVFWDSHSHSDFFLFPHLKIALGCQRFSSNGEAITFVNNYFAEKNTKYYLDGLQRWEHRWEKSPCNYKETMLKNLKNHEKMSCIFVRSETFQTTFVFEMKGESYHLEYNNDVRLNS